MEPTSDFINNLTFVPATAELVEETNNNNNNNVVVVVSDDSHGGDETNSDVLEISSPLSSTKTKIKKVSKTPGRVKSIVWISGLLHNDKVHSGDQPEIAKRCPDKEFYIVIKYFLVGDSKGTIHQKKIRFGVPEANEDYIYHKDEIKRYKLNLKSRCDFEPITTKFWKLTICNGTNTNPQINYIMALTSLKKRFGHFEKPKFQQEAINELTEGFANDYSS
jgi:hypothetical protein